MLSIKYFFQKHKKILQTPNIWMIVYLVKKHGNMVYNRAWNLKNKVFFNKRLVEEGA